METFSIKVLAVIFLCISVSEQQQQLNNFDGHRQFIDSLREQTFNSPSHAARELSGQYGYEVSNGKLIIKPCETRRRAMPENFGYPIQINEPLAFRSGYPTQNNEPAKSVDKTILVGKDKGSNPIANQLKLQRTTEPEPEQINDYELESNNEASEHIIKHNEAVPSHGDSESHPISVKDEVQSTTKATTLKEEPTTKISIFHPVPHIITKYVDKEDPNKFIHSKIMSPSGAEQPPQNVSPSKIPQSNCVHNDKTENTQGDVSNFATNSRRSMGGISDTRSGATHRVPASTMKLIQKNQEKDAETLSNLSDVSNRFGYPSVLPYSPRYLAASSPVSPLGGRVLMDPTKGAGIAPFKDSQLAIMESHRVCYACTSLNDPTCYYPEKGTTVKYCRSGHNSCVTKTVRSTSANDKDLIVIRDCGEVCDTGSTAPLVTTDSCSICGGGDLCNDSPVNSGAFSIAPLSALLLCIFTWIFKTVL